MKALTMVKPWWFTALIVLLVVIWSVPNSLTTEVAQADKLTAPMDSVMVVSTERISVSFDGSQGTLTVTPPRQMPVSLSCQRMGAMWRSSLPLATWCRVTPTERQTSSAAPSDLLVLSSV
jgi:hypothetical protein